MFRKILFFTLLFFVPQLTLAATSLGTLAEFTGVADDGAGRSIASAGDVDGDGYEDFIIGAYLNSDGASEAGATYLIYGSATEFSGNIDLSTQAVEFIGEAASDHSGKSVGPAGDVNGDGYDDFLIGAAENDENGNTAGAVYLVYGKSTRYSGAINITTSITFSSNISRFVGESALSMVGASTSYAGDVNGDGYDDFVVGGYNYSSLTGVAYLVYGQSDKFGDNTVLSTSTASRFIGEDVDDYAGATVSNAGDVDNDGYDDFLIGSRNDDGGLFAGSAYLIYGQSTPLSSVNLSTKAQFIGDSGEYASYNSLSAAGDVNGDGFDDFLIGAVSNDEAANNAGTTYLVYGKTADYTGNITLSSAAAQFQGEAESDNAGQGTAPAGDVNGDSYDDFLISADNTNTNTGSVYFIYGQSDKYTGILSLTNADMEFVGENTNDYAGIDIAYGGDVNGDGFLEFLVGAEGNDDGGSAAGSAYLGYWYIDNDGDGVAGTSGLLSGTDCSDSDGTVSSNQTYYVDSDGDGYGSTTTASLCAATAPTGYSSNATDCSDSDATVYTNQTYYLDADGDGYGSDTTTSTCSSTAPDGYVSNSDDDNDNDYDNDGSETGTDCNDEDADIYANQTYYLDADGDTLGSDETGSYCSLTAPDGYVSNSYDPDDSVAHHPTYYRYDPTDKDQYDAAVTEVEGMTNGQIKVTYKDNSSYTFTIYNVTDSKKTKAKQYRSKGYYIVSQPRGKKLSIVNIYTGQVENTVTVASKKKYPINALKIMELQGKYFAVLISRKKSDVRVYAAKIVIKTPKFGKDTRLKLTDSKVTPSKTIEYKTNQFRLKGSSGKVRHTLKMNYTSAKKYVLEEI